MKELADAIRAQAAAGRNVVLSPETALRLTQCLDTAPRRASIWNINVHVEGSTVYLLDARGEIAEVVAFAKSALVARAAFEYLCENHPNESYSQRSGARVEAERIVDRVKANSRGNGGQ